MKLNLLMVIWLEYLLNNMKIVICKEEKNINLRLPNWIFLNKIVCKCIYKKLNEINVKVNKNQFCDLIKLCKKYKKKNKGWKIIEVYQRNEQVIIEM